MVNPLTNEPAGRPTPFGALLSTAGRRLASDLDEALGRAGFTDLRAAHTPLFMAIEPEGSTSTELAARAHMTKQSMGELVRHLKEHGYVDVTVGPTDRRARIVQLTDRGRDAHDAGLRVVDAFDRWFAEAIGAEEVQRVREVLHRIIDSDWQEAKGDELGAPADRT